MCLHNLFYTTLLKDSSLNVIKSFIFNSHISGVPLGMPFSSALSEVYLEEFDDAIRRKFSPIFYVRYVDDILMVKSYPVDNTIDKESEKKLLYRLLDEISLSANETKTDIYEYRSANDELNFDYLGLT